MLRTASGNLPAQSRVLLIVRRAFDQKIFENEGVFPAIERSAAADATDFRVNRGYGFNFHQRVFCRAMRAVVRICVKFFCHGAELNFDRLLSD